MASIFGTRAAKPFLPIPQPQPTGKALISGIPLASGVNSATTDPSQAMAAPAAPMWKKPSTLQTIAGVIGDSLAQWQGGQPLFAQSNMLRQKAMYDAAMAQQERANKFADWQQQYDYQLAHPKPDNNDTVNDFNFISSQLGPDAAKEYLKNMAAGQPIPIRNPDGTYSILTRDQFSNPTPQPAPAGVTFTPLPEGGATPTGSRPFP